MDPVSTAASLIAARQGVGRLEAGMAMLGQQIRSEGQGAVALTSAAGDAAASATSLPAPAAGKGLVVDVLA